MSSIENISGIHLNQYSLTGDQQKQLTSCQQKISNASQKTNLFSKTKMNFQSLEVKEIGIQEDKEVLQQDFENLQIDNADNYQEEQTINADLPYSIDFKLKNEFLKSVQRTNESTRLAMDRISKFG